MKMIKPLFYTFIFCALGQFGCTSNPVGENNISPQNLMVRGSVILSDNLNKDGVYIWMDGFNLSTRTDTNGAFELTLPGPAGSSGITGAFNIYYYLANFILAKTEVFTRNGEFIYAIGEIDSKGELIAPKFLQQSLQIITTVQPTSVSLNNLGDAVNLRVEVILQSFVDSVIVYFPQKVEELTSPLIFRNTSSNEIVILNSIVSDSAVADLDTIKATPTVRVLTVPLEANSLVPGQYEIIPFLLIKDESAPVELLESLGPAAQELGPGYLDLPFRRQGVNRFLTVSD